MARKKQQEQVMIAVDPKTAKKLAKQQRKRGSGGALLILLLLIVIIGGLSAVGGRGGSNTSSNVPVQAVARATTPPQPADTPEPTLEPARLLARAEAGLGAIPAGAEADFRAQLDDLTAACSGDQGETAKLLLGAQAVMKEKGVNITLTELIRGVRSSIPDDPKARLTCSDHITAYALIATSK